MVSGHKIHPSNPSSLVFAPTNVGEVVPWLLALAPSDFLSGDLSSEREQMSNDEGRKEGTETDGVNCDRISVFNLLGGDVFIQVEVLPTIEGVEGF